MLAASGAPTRGDKLPLTLLDHKLSPHPRLASFAGEPTLPVKGRVEEKPHRFEMLREAWAEALPSLTLPLMGRVAAEGGGVG